jgi:hypothetical protein
VGGRARAEPCGGDVQAGLQLRDVQPGRAPRRRLRGRSALHGNRDLYDDFGIEASPTTGLASIFYSDDQYQNDANHKPYPVYGCTPADTDASTCQHTNVATQTSGTAIYSPKKK